MTSTYKSLHTNLYTQHSTYKYLYIQISTYKYLYLQISLQISLCRYDVSKLQFSEVYERLDVTCLLYGESEYNSMIPNVVQELEEKGLLTDDLNAKNGLVAHVAWVRDCLAIPLFLVKSDGGYGYVFIYFFLLAFLGSTPIFPCVCSRSSP